MNIYVALHDAAPGTQNGNKSGVVGAFSTEEKARAACQEDADARAEGGGRPLVPLAWRDTETHPLADGSSYDVVAGDLDVPTGF